MRGVRGIWGVEGRGAAAQRLRQQLWRAAAAAQQQQGHRARVRRTPQEMEHGGDTAALQNKIKGPESRGPQPPQWERRQACQYRRPRAGLNSLSQRHGPLSRSSGLQRRPTWKAGSRNSHSSSSSSMNPTTRARGAKGRGRARPGATKSG